MKLGVNFCTKEAAIRARFWGVEHQLERIAKEKKKKTLLKLKKKLKKNYDVHDCQLRHAIRIKAP